MILQKKEEAGDRRKLLQKKKKKKTSAQRSCSLAMFAAAVLFYTDCTSADPVFNDNSCKRKPHLLLRLLDLFGAK